MELPDGQVILNEELDENYEPTEQEILEYAQWLGIDVEKERDFFWIARQGLKAPLPEHWKPCKTPQGDIYYFNFNNGDSVWDHPCDEHYRKLYQEEKAKRQAADAATKSQPIIQPHLGQSQQATRGNVHGPSPLGLSSSNSRLATLEPLPLSGKLQPLDISSDKLKHIVGGAKGIASFKNNDPLLSKSFDRSGTSDDFDSYGSMSGLLGNGSAASTPGGGGGNSLPNPSPTSAFNASSSSSAANNIGGGATNWGGLATIHSNDGVMEDTPPLSRGSNPGVMDSSSSSAASAAIPLSPRPGIGSTTATSSAFDPSPSHITAPETPVVSKTSGGSGAGNGSNRDGGIQDREDMIVNNNNNNNNNNNSSSISNSHNNYSSNNLSASVTNNSNGISNSNNNIIPNSSGGFTVMTGGDKGSVVLMSHVSLNMLNHPTAYSSPTRSPPPLLMKQSLNE